MGKFVVLALFLLLVNVATAALTVSPDGGFYPDALNITLSASAGNMILYTLDGTNPLQNGTPFNESATVLARDLTPTPLAVNTDTAIFTFTIPNTTLKGTVLRAVEVLPNGSQKGKELIRTYFIGQDAASYQVPVISIITEQRYLDDYDIGMLIKGATYYNDLAANGGNPANPFRPANWNNDSLRWPAQYELYVGGALQLADLVVLYPSGRTSAGYAQKSLKLKYDKDIGGPSKTTYPFFGNDSLPEYSRLRLRQGSQDWSGGNLIRDCASGEAIQGLNVEAAKCAQAAVYINGEYWGVYNLIEDVDDKYLAVKYAPMKKDDVVILEQDGLIDEGATGDNAPYFALKAWLATHNLANETNYEYFESQVNVESVIDYYSTIMFINNVDFPADHRFWHNKNPASQVPGTPADGRWYFDPKDRDQSMGLYDHINYTDNTVQKFLSQSPTNAGTIFLVKGMENPTFRAQFIARNIELLDTTFSSATLNETFDRVASEKRPEMNRQMLRWRKPSNTGWWEKNVNETKTWLARRNVVYRQHILALNGTDTIAPAISGGQPTGVLPSGTLSATLGVLTDENATCAYTNVSGQAFSSMTAFTSTGARNHTATLFLANGRAYNYFVKCRDAFNNTNPLDYPVVFSVANATAPTNGTNTTNNQTNASVCYSTLAPIPASCSAGSVTLDTFAAGCRLITCTSSTGLHAIKACPKSAGWFEMYPVTRVGLPPTVCIGETCLKANSGFVKSPNFPICINATNSTPADTVAPIVSAGQPAGALPAGTTSTTLSVTTNEPAVCAYSILPGQSYAVMLPFSSTSNLVHQTSFGPLLPGVSYTAYVKCRDAHGNTNSADYPITFSVSTSSTPPVTYAVNVTVAAWYPKNLSDGTHYVFVCNQNVNATAYDWYFSNGGKSLNRPDNTIYKIFATAGTYTTTCVARGTPVMNGSLTATV